MKVQCGHCPAKYAVSDDRVQGRKVRIRCKRCGAAIVVDGKHEPPTVTCSPARRSAGASEPAGERLSVDPPAPDPSQPPPSRPVAHTILGGLEAPVAERLLANGRSVPPPKPQRRPTPAGGSEGVLPDRRPGAPAAGRGFTDPPAGSDPNRWRVALTKNDMRFMTTAEIAEAFRAGVVQEETFVVKKGMKSWVTLLEVAEIATALGLQVYEPSSPPPPRKRGSSGPPPRQTTAADDETDEPLPFELVAQQAAVGRKPEPEAARDENAFLTLATPSPQAAEESRAPAETGQSATPDTTPLAPAVARERVIDSSAPTVPPRGEAAATAADSAAASDTAAGAAAPPAPSDAAEAGTAATPEAAVAPAPPAGRRSRPWLLIAALVLAAGAALVFLGPRLGLKLF